MQLSVILTMPLTFLIMFASTHLENLDLFVATLCHDRCLNLSTFDQWGTEANGFTFTDGKNLIESDFGSNVSRYLFYFIFFTRDNLILLAAGPSNKLCVDKT